MNYLGCDVVGRIIRSKVMECPATILGSTDVVMFSEIGRRKDLSEI